ncbi:MAG: putative methyltransferase [Acidimicrobiia bacterium]|nr:putative methyltransferase [Acidimicrobiia bacterium]
MIGLQNAKIQRLRRLLGRRSARLEEGVFVIEGPTLVREAVEAGLNIEAVYTEFAGLSYVPQDVELIEVADGVLAKVGSTVSPQPILAIASLLTKPVPANATFVVACAGVADPGNAGTILRSAEAAGADAVVFTAGSVDVYNPKCVRASAGALFHIPVSVDVDLRSLGLPVVGAVADGGTPHDAYDLRGPVMLVLGNEAHGLPADLVLDGLITVEHVGRAESLNVAMASTVLCFEVARQRR